MTPVSPTTPLRLDRAAERHTPGPWYALCYDDGSFTISADPEGYVILCQRNLWSHRAAESVANARLIAAAPKMLKALQHCLGILCESGNLNNYRNLSDEELGKAWVETAKEAAAVLNEAMGITSPAELAFPDGGRG